MSQISPKNSIKIIIVQKFLCYGFMREGALFGAKRGLGVQAPIGTRSEGPWGPEGSSYIYILFH